MFAECSLYYPIISKKETLLHTATLPDANVTLAFTDNREIIGLGILQYPGTNERWLRVGSQIMMEVSVIEVGREWRSLGLSKVILGQTIDHPLKEERILYMVGYSWTWDMSGKNLNPTAYRNMMIDLFSRFGFEAFQTSEPNITLLPENLFMARIGSDISESVRRQFKMVRFNLDL